MRIDGGAGNEMTFQEQLLAEGKHGADFLAAGQWLQQKQQPLLVGLPDVAKAIFAANLYQQSQTSLLILTPNMDAANVWQQNLTALLPEAEVLMFPRLALLPFEVSGHNVEVAAQRLQALSALCAGRKVCLVTPISALVRKLVPQAVLRESHLQLQVGQDFPLEELAKKLVQMGYTRESMVDVSGTFSSRGGILDIFPLTSKRPVRLEFFDTEIESIRYFDPGSQRSQEALTGGIWLTPVREVPLSEETMAAGLRRLQAEFAATLKQLTPTARRHLREKFSPYLEWLQQGIWQDGMDHFFHQFYPTANHLLDYLPQAAPLLLDEPAAMEQTLDQIVAERDSYYYDLLEAGQILPSFAENFYKQEELLAAINARNHLGFALLAERSKILFGAAKSSGARVIPGYVRQMNLLAEDMQHWQKQGYRQYFCASSPLRANQMQELLQEYGVTSAQIGVAALSQGFEYPEGKLVVVTERELLGKTAKAKKRRLTRKDNALETFVDLKEGDLVVHANHGIGRYLGMERIQIDDVARDYLKIGYAGTDKLYVPVDQMDLVQKYIGNEGAAPKLYKLGGNQWQRVKSKVKASVQDMAKELLKLYAARQQAQGFAFAPDDHWQQEFEDAFEYEETPGQLQAIAEIKKDMESKLPMDRLLCGDVGYGKTEVAMRAAFKAVMNSKQVAMLVPTTLLAEQHYHTFQERFSGYPVRVAVVSRFVPAKKQKEILNDVKKGAVDILIGTHRLLSKDIAFHDIGLLIVDEEQRFGVAHKEKLKQWKENIDVLTLSATPIPRTLHMSLVGMRDMSVIDTPPEDRYPVQTFVVEYHPHLIKDALERELARNGQVYFVHNRVLDIQKVANEVQALVPNARVLIAHGKMSERQLEQVMTEFIAGNGDILVCTTIAESGLDIPNVNTLIVNEADHFGLSQLYQLRGRVGRSSRQAYAYFTYGKDKIVNEVAKKRLTAIRDFTQLGSGFKIAMRDMEIRGAGNILGPEQHGHIAAVGFDMYCKLVAEEVEAGLSQTPKPKEREAVQLDLGVNAFIPDSYLSDAELKIEVYKRIAAMSGDEAEEKALMQEVSDRFGKMPPVVENLFLLGDIKVLATQADISAIQHRGKQILLQFFPDHRLEGQHLVAIAEKFGKWTSFRQQKGFAIQLAIGNLPERKRLLALRSFLKELLAIMAGSE